MDIQVPVFSKYDDNDMSDLLFTEASGATTIVKTYLEPFVTNTLNDPIKDKKFKKLVSDFINRNMTELNKSGPINLIAVTDIDKDNFFNLFGINKKELISTIASATSKINDKANWKLIQQNPLFSLLYMTIRHYIIKKDEITASDLEVLSKCFNNSIVGTSKLLHFIYPDKYPIWDSNVCKYFTDGEPFSYRVNKVSNYLKYIDFCNGLIENNKEGIAEIQKEFITEFDLEISKMRTLELIFFQVGKNKEVVQMITSKEYR